MRDYMNTKGRPTIRKMSRQKIVILFFLAILGAYYVMGYLLVSQVDSYYAQRDCSTLVPLAEKIIKSFPKIIAPFTNLVEIQARECQLYLQAEANYIEQDWSLAYKNYDKYLKTYSQGIYFMEVRKAAADSLYHWAKKQQADLDYTGVEASLIILRDSYSDIFLTTQINQYFNELYIAWAKNLMSAKKFEEAEEKYKKAIETELTLGATGNTQLALAELYFTWASELESTKKFAEAENKYKQAINSDPNPTAKDGLSARSQESLRELQRSWAQDLLASNQHMDAVEHLKIFINLLGSDYNDEVSDDLANVYIQWGIFLVSSEDYRGALEKIALAELSASNAIVKDEAKTARDNVLVAFSESSSTQAKELMRLSANKICTNKSSADLSSYPVLGIDPNNKRALLHGVDFRLSNYIWAKTPGTSYYVVCITENTMTIESCIYEDGYSIERISTDWFIEMRSLSTGKIHQQTTIFGKSPESCPEVHKFLSSFERSHPHTGDLPSPRDLELWLSEFIK